MRSTRHKTSSNLVNNQAHEKHTPRNIRGPYDDKTYCSWMAPEVVPFLRLSSTDTKRRAVVLLHYWGSQHDRYWSGLKQQAQEVRSNHGTSQKSLHLKWYIPLSKNSAYSSRLPLWLLLARHNGALPARGFKRRVLTARRRLNWLRVSASVDTTKENHSSFTNAYEIPNIWNCAEHSQNNWNVVPNLMHNTWEDSLKGWVLHRRMSHAPPQIHFQNHPERQEKHPQDEPHAPEKNQTLKYKNPMLPSSSLGARRILAYGKHGWPPYYFL